MDHGYVKLFAVISPGGHCMCHVPQVHVATCGLRYELCIFSEWHGWFACVIVDGSVNNLFYFNLFCFVKTKKTSNGNLYIKICYKDMYIFLNF